MRGLVLILALLSAAGCGLNERDDYLVGRPCTPGVADVCDEGQVCLPHEWSADGPGAYRCRSAASFQQVGNEEAPLAYCDDTMFFCPAGLVCNADRIREDAGFRQRVCKLAGDPFAPPLDAGPSW